MRLRGIGVDLVDLDRVKRFLRDHGTQRARRILSEREVKRLRGRSISPLAFARLFAAKEAFFKCLNRSWLGVEGFRDLEITPLSATRFRARTADGHAAVETEGCFFRRERWIGAQVILWES